MFPRHNYIRFVPQLIGCYDPLWSHHHWQSYIIIRFLIASDDDALKASLKKKLYFGRLYKAFNADNFRRFLQNHLPQMRRSNLLQFPYKFERRPFIVTYMTTFLKLASGGLNFLS